MSRKYQWYLGSLCLLGLAMIVVATWRYGAGVSSDAVRNLSTVDSMLAGRGFVDLNSKPLTWWPPFYPMLLYVFSLATKADPFIVAWYLNVFLYIVNIWLTGWFFWVAFRGKPVFAAVCMLVFILSRSVLSVYANVSSDPLFITMMFAYFYLAAKYLEIPSNKLRWLFFILSGVMFLHRYPGIVFFALSGLLILYREGIRTALRSLPQALIGVLPSAAWAYFFTYAQSGTFFGPRAPDMMLPLANANLSLARMVQWFIPNQGWLASVFQYPWILLIVSIVILLVVNKKQNWSDLGRAVADVYILPYVVFAILYYVLMLFTVVTADHVDIRSDRYYIVLFPLVLVLMVFILRYHVFCHFDVTKPFLRYAVVLVFLFWLAYPLYGLQRYLRLSLENGEASTYNIQNTRKYHELKVIELGRRLIEEDPDAMVYSNYANVIWFAYRRPVDMLPMRAIELSFSERIDYLEENYPAWPNGRDGYLIWFKPNQYYHIAQPRELELIAKVELIYEDKKSAIYRVSTK